MRWWIRNPEVVCTELENGAVLLHLETRTYYSLNRSALGIWQLVDHVGSIDELCRELTSRFELPAERGPEIVARFLEQLAVGQLLSESEVEASRAPVSGAAGHGVDRPIFEDPELIVHDEPLHEVPLAPFDPQLPLAE